MQLRDEHMCYVIQSTITNKVYVGYTVNFARRLRQHNGELVGGAKKTARGRPWKPICVLSGFYDQSSALRFEYRIHKTKIKKRRTEDGVQHVIRVISSLIDNGDGSIAKDNKISWPPLTIYWFCPGYIISHSAVTNTMIES